MLLAVELEQIQGIQMVVLVVEEELPVVALYLQVVWKILVVEEVV
jgi:hypothetical protein